VVAADQITLDGVMFVSNYEGTAEARAIYFDDSNGELRDITIQNCIFKDFSMTGIPSTTTKVIGIKIAGWVTNPKIVGNVIRDFTGTGNWNAVGIELVGSTSPNVITGATIEDNLIQGLDATNTWLIYADKHSGTTILNNNLVCDDGATDSVGVFIE